jgi:hypothetical protein
VTRRIIGAAEAPPRAVFAMYRKAIQLSLSRGGAGCLGPVEVSFAIALIQETSTAPRALAIFNQEEHIYPLNTRPLLAASMFER